MKKERQKSVNTERKQNADKPWLFQKGQSGNPKGKPTGSRNRATLLLEGLVADQGQEIVQECIARAMEGDNVLLKALLERLVPVRKDSPMRAKLPKIKGADDLPKALDAVQQQLTEGELTPTEATALTALLEHHRKALETNQLEQRLAAIEKKLEEVVK